MTPQNKTITVVLPAYNERLTIAKVIKAFHAALPEANIVVVNNNSSDDTGQIASDVLKELGAVGQVLDEPRKGKGNAVRRAFRDIEADVYVLSDADLTYPAGQVSELIRPILDGTADMLVGDRHTSGHYEKENKRRLHGFGNALVRWLVNKLFNVDLSAIMSGCRVFSRAFVKSYPILVESFELETDMTLHALGKRGGSGNLNSRLRG